MVFAILPYEAKVHTEATRFSVRLEKIASDRRELCQSKWKNPSRRAFDHLCRVRMGPSIILLSHKDPQRWPCGVEHSMVTL